MAAAQGDPSKQSLISRQIKELEDQLGFSLIDRSVKPYTLNQAGKDLELTVRKFINQMEQNVAHHTNQSEVITIAAGESVILWLLIPMIAKIPSVLHSQIRFRNMQSQQAVEAIIAVRADLAFHSNGHYQKSLIQKTVSSYRMCIIAKPDILSKRPKTSWNKLPNLPLVYIGGGGSTNKLIEQLTLSYPEGPYKSIECTSHNQVMEVTRQMPALGVVPVISTKKAKELGLNIINLQEFTEQEYSLTASWSSSTERKSPILQSIIKNLKLND